ncbi:MAG TPA: GNAT family N-acetyltransferase [Terriglobales bacterium]|nr:GNAT family N-acetyltransferase [Terriglobales bacterium]
MAFDMSVAGTTAFTDPPEPVLETERLILRHLDVSDADFILALLNEPSFLHYIGDRQVRSVDDAVGYILKGPAASYRQHGFGLDLVQLKSDGSKIGICGLIQRDYLPHPDIGYAFLQSYCAKGYGVEAAAGVLQHARLVLGLPRVLAITSDENIASIRVLEKIGLGFQNHFEQPGYPSPSRLYSVDFDRTHHLPPHAHHAAQ